MSVFVMAAGFSGIFQRTGKICFQDIFKLAGAAADDFYAASREPVQGSGPIFPAIRRVTPLSFSCSATPDLQPQL